MLHVLGLIWQVLATGLAFLLALALLVGYRQIFRWIWGHLFRPERLERPDPRYRD